MPRGQVPVRIERNGGSIAFDATLALETSSEVDVLAAGGILPLILARPMRAWQAFDVTSPVLYGSRHPADGGSSQDLEE